MFDLGYSLTSDKAFDKVVENIEKNTASNQFRVMAIHDVQSSLAEKGLERGQLKIIEVCNAGFAHKALQQDIAVAMFMPCKFTVYTIGEKTIVTLARPTMISQVFPEANLDELAESVEGTLKTVMEQSV